MKESPTNKRSRTGRRLAAAGLAVLGALLVAWFTTPWWVPAAMPWLLPPDWRVEQVALRRPGLSATRIEHLRLRGDVAGGTVTIDVSDALFTYRGPLINLAEVDVTVSPAPPSTIDDSTTAWRDLIAFPPLPTGGAWPAATVGRLALKVGDTAQAKRYELEDLRLEPAPNGGQLRAGLSPVPLLTANGQLSLNGKDGALDVALTLEGAAPEPLLRYRQPAHGTAASARLVLDLGLLDLEALAPWSAAAGVGTVSEAAGRLHLAVELQGAERLQPVSGRLEAEALAITGDELSIDVSGTVAFEGLQDDRPQLGTDGLELALGVARADWLVALEEQLAASGVRGLVTGAPVRLGLLVAKESQLAFDTTGGHFALDGGASVVWDQEGTGSLELATTGLRVSRGAVSGVSLAADSLSAAFNHRGVIEAVLDGIPLAIEGPSLRAQGRAALATDASPGLEVSIGTATARRLKADLAGLHATLEELALGGRLLADGGGIEFDGPLAGRRLTVGDGSDNGAASLLSAESLRAGLVLEDFDRLASRGPVELYGVRLASDSLRMSRLDVALEDWSLAAGSGAFSAVTTGLERMADGKPQAGLDLDLDGALEAWTRAAGTGEALAGLARALPFAWRADLDRGAIELQFENAELEAIGLRSALRPLGVTLPEPLKFRSGSIFLDGDVTLSMAGDSPDAGGAIDLQAEALEFSYGESLVAGLDFRTRVELADALRSTGRLSAEIVQLAAGLDLTGLDAGLRTIGESDIGIERLSAQLLGGSLEAVELSVVGGAPQAATVEWLGFDLGLLLAFLDVDGLDGTGTIDARFPIASEGGALIIEDGEFAARGPGRIRYTTGAPAANIGLQALENFEYDALDGKINYAADGAYTIALRLLGRNPDLYGGHPVRFRLNLGGELPALFRSLFVTGDFDRAIIERLRSRAGELEE